MSETRKDVLLKAIEAEVGVAPVDLSTLFTEDAVGWSPYASVSGLAALAELAARREEAFSNVAVMFRGLGGTRPARRASPSVAARTVPVRSRSWTTAGAA